MVDIVIALDALLGDFERSSRDITEFCDELLNGLELGVDSAIVASGTSSYDVVLFFEALYNGIFYYFDDIIADLQWRQSDGLVYVIEEIINHRATGPDGTVVPRDDAPDVVIVLSEGYSTIEAQDFIQRIEPRARYGLVWCKH